MTIAALEYGVESLRRNNIFIASRRQSNQLSPRKLSFFLQSVRLAVDRLIVVLPLTDSSP